jgi:hypothetical protein
MVREYNKHLSQTDIQDTNVFTVPKMKNLHLLEKFPTLNEMKWTPDGDEIGFRLNTAFKVQKRLLLFDFIET